MVCGLQLLKHVQPLPVCIYISRSIAEIRISAKQKNMCISDVTCPAFSNMSHVLLCSFFSSFFLLFRKAAKTFYLFYFSMVFPSPYVALKSFTNASTALSTATLFTKFLMTSGATVAAPTPYFASSSTCCVFLKLAARTFV